MASHMGCDWIVLKPEDKPLYHAAAVIVSNYVVTLLDIATKLFEHFGISPRQATDVLMPLIQGNPNNIKEIGLPDCLTGPIARGDVSTIKKHITAFERREASLLKLYRELGLKTIPIALAKGSLDNKAGESLQVLLKEISDRATKETTR